MQIACYLATVVFAQFTYWQFNDLEQYGTRFWLGWVGVYGATALIALISARHRLPRALHVCAAAAASVAAMVRATSIEWGSKIFYHETNPAGNETGGLVIVGLWFTLLAIVRSSRPPEKASAEE